MATKKRNPQDATIARNIHPLKFRLRELEHHRKRMDAELKAQAKQIRLLRGLVLK